MNTTPAFAGYIRPHVSINVNDLDKSIAFYNAFFGIAPEKVRADYAKWSLQSPALNFSMNYRPHGTGNALGHLGIEVGSTEDVHAAQTRLQTAGLLPVEEMQVTCCYAEQDKIWVEDPDGNSWEVFTVTKKDTATHSGEAVAKEGAVCCAAPVEAVAVVVPELELASSCGCNGAC